MNPIELEWQHIKEDELAGQMFDDELELAYAVMDGVEVKGKRGNYSTQRIKFKSRHLLNILLHICYFPRRPT
jgi:putative transposase